MSHSGTAYYLYCLTPCECRVPASAAGVDGKLGVMVRACGEIAAVFSEVERGEFCGESAEAHLQDLAWLGPRVCRHETVIEEVMSRVRVLPAPFATLFTSFDSLQQFVLERRDAFAGFFDQLGDKQEWAVKGLLNRGEALGRPGFSGRRAADERVRIASPGARYFQEKRIQAQWERDLHVRLIEFCRRAVMALAEHAGGFRARKALAAAAAETDAEVVLNWAFLVSPAALDEFQGRLARLNGGEAFPGLTMTSTGPWPPYSFVPDLSSGAKA